MSMLITVPFHGDTIDTTQDDEGVWVGLRRACKGLGVSFQGQVAKLRDKEWATLKTVLTVAEDGRRREVMMIHLDSLPMWLATIESGRVKPASRPKVIRYQKECARVLRDHFFKAPGKLPVYVQRLQLAAKMFLTVPPGYWTVFDKASSLLILVEVEFGLAVDKFDLLDLSVGSHWSKHRAAQPWAGERVTYRHIFPDHRGVRDAWAYSHAELAEFDRWLRQTYIVKHLGPYLESKYELPLPTQQLIERAVRTVQGIPYRQG